jgi:serine/threonine-protein kinase RsbW
MNSSLIEISTQKTGDSTILRLNGRFDGNTAPQVLAHCQDLISAGEKKLVFDFSKVTYVSSAGLSCILGSGKRLLSSGGAVLLCGAGGEVRKVLEMSGFLDVFQTIGDPVAGQETGNSSVPSLTKLDQVSLKVLTDQSQLETLRRFMLDCAHKAQVTQDSISQLELVLEEMFMNTMNHGYKRVPGDLELRCWSDSSLFFLQFIDQAPPFNPLDHPVPNLDLPLAERQIGGLGIHLVKEAAEVLEYKYDQANILTVGIKATPPFSGKG